MKRTSLRRTTPLRSNTPLRSLSTLRRRVALRPMSDKRRKMAKERAEFVARVLAERPMCEFPTDEILIYGVGASPRAANGPCPNRAVDVHESLTRARGGSVLDEANALLLCREHHDLVHDNPAWAESVGLLRHSWD